MKLTKREIKLIREFDQAETTLVISHWPISQAQLDGIATYTQDIVMRFSREYNHKFVVFVPYDYQGSRVRQINQNILLVGVFDERHLHLYPQIIGWLGRFAKIDNVVVHSEFCASGGFYIRAMVVPFLALIKLTGRTITYYAHNVAEDIGAYALHLGLSRGLGLTLTRVLYPLYLKTLGLVVDKFVVLEKSMAERLYRLLGKNAVIEVVPHWIAQRKLLFTREQARKSLKISTADKLVVSFGFVSWYKGSDIVIAATRNLPKSYKLVLAGGEAVSLKNKKHYQQYYLGLVGQMRKMGNVRITGFLADREIDRWLRAADLVILPYRLSMGGSGALQQALAHNKPVILSSAVERGLGLDWPVKFESGSDQSLAEAIKQYFGNKKTKLRVDEASKQLASERDVRCLLFDHYNRVYRNPQIKKPMLKWMGEQVKTSWATIVAR